MPSPRARTGGSLRLLLVGKTERDHAFAAEVMEALPAGVVELRVMTHPEQHHHYQGKRNIRLMPRLDDAGLLSEYQQADLLFVPLLDCTANNTVLEAMACGTPVMVNRVGGIPEYVNPSVNRVMDGKDHAAWVETLVGLSWEVDLLEAHRPAVRAWAERIDWALMAEPYRELFARLLASPGRVA